VQGLLTAILVSANAMKILKFGTPVTITDFQALSDFSETLTVELLIVFCYMLGTPLIATLWMVIRNFQRPRGRRLWQLAPLFASWTVCAALVGLPNSFLDTINPPYYGFVLTPTFAFASIYVRNQRHYDANRIAQAEHALDGGRNLIRQMRPAAKEASPQTNRNVYVFLMESFWDPSQIIPGKKSSDFLSPEFLELWEKSGRAFMLSPVFGQGTANAEFEVLCGMPVYLGFPKGVPFYRILTKDVPCLPAIFHELGYRANAFHPGVPHFYNRDYAYPRLGFERYFSGEKLFLDEVTDGVLSDRSLFRQVNAENDRERATNAIFSYTMTYEGHWPFSLNKELHPIRMTLKSLGISCDDTDGQVVRDLNMNWDISAEIAREVKHLEEVDPTALIVIAGDHLPTIASRFDPTFSGYPRVTRPFFRTPLVVIDGKNHEKTASGDIVAYDIPRLILGKLGPQKSDDFMIRLFERHDPFLLRTGLGPDLVVTSSGQEISCDKPDKAPECKAAATWEENSRTVRTDIVFGNQYVLKNKNP
jgi:phosphoglycerol transferase MdoB-like AlkP superfamily enzyme